jgi:GTP1/Obg family GTP-binding protein
MTVRCSFELLEQLPKFFRRETSITSDTAHGKSIDRVIAWNSNNANSVGHDYVLALANDSKSGS